MRIDRMQREIFLDCGKSNAICTLQELAALFSVTPSRISQLVHEGLPKNSEGQYPLKDCVSWYVRFLLSRLNENQNETVVSERIKLIRAKSRKAEIEIKKMEGEISDNGQVKQQLIKIFTTIKEEFLSLPGQCAPDLEEKSAQFIKIYLNKKIAQTLNITGEKINEAYKEEN